MRLELSVAGFSAGWEFHGSPGFDSWAHERPWTGEGGICLLRTLSSAAAGLFFQSACGLLRAANGDGRPVLIKRVECGGAAGTPKQAVLRSLDVDPAASPFQAKETLGLRLSDHPVVLVISEVEEVEAGSWYELALLIEHFGKSRRAVPLTVIVIDARGLIAHEPSYDFTSGRCTHSVLSGAAQQEDAIVWRAYLHHRACWEAAGDPVEAQVLGDRLGMIPIGQEAEVERSLLEFATVRAKISELESLRPTVMLAASRFHSAQRERARQHLKLGGCLWRPPGLQRYELTPWASRYLLSRPMPAQELIPRFRHNLVCMPLASEIMSHCLNAESKIRMQLAGKHVGYPGEKTADSHRTYCEGRHSSVYYPSGYPLPPDRAEDVWAFASLGEIMTACPPENVPDALWETLRLRNAVAHGHYVTWLHVRQALTQLRRFDS